MVGGVFLGGAVGARVRGAHPTVEHMVVVVRLAKEESDDRDSSSVFGRADVLEDGGWGVAVRLEGKKVLRPEDLVVRPPSGEDPGVGPGFDEAFGHLVGCGG